LHQDSCTIVDDACCLERLLKSPKKLSQSNFLDLFLDEESRERFLQFLNAGENGTPTMPRGLRISLQGADGPVSMDVFHTKLPTSGSASSNYCLLAMKEDPEQQTPPDAAPGSTPSINATFTSRTAGSRSSVSEVVQTYPDLTEIALLCSNATGLLDIEEAHLLFQRQEWRPNIESGMPTLRRFIRPSDWDRIEKMIQNVVNLPPADIDIERRCYFGHPMLFRIPGESRSYLSSNTTSISLAHRGGAVRSPSLESERPDPIHFWMHFSSFDDARIRRPKEQELEEIAEGDEAYEDNAQLDDILT